MFHYLYTFELKRSAKSKTCKEAEKLSSLGASWECWFLVSKQKGEGLGQNMS